MKSRKPTRCGASDRMIVATLNRPESLVSSGFPGDCPVNDCRTRRHPRGVSGVADTAVPVATGASSGSGDGARSLPSTRRSIHFTGTISRRDP